MSKIQDVILVRHGESVSNVTQRFAYRTWDPPLTERGQRQAQALATALRTLPISCLATSPLLRTRKTIEPLSQALGIDPLVVDDLMEVNLGRWDGALMEEISVSETDKDLYAAWRKDPEAFPPPGGESVLAVGRRILRGLDRLLDDHSGTLVVAATHGDCLKGAALAALGAPGECARRMKSPNVGMVFLARDADRRWRLNLAPALTAGDV